MSSIPTMEQQREFFNGPLKRSEFNDPLEQAIADANYNHAIVSFSDFLLRGEIDDIREKLYRDRLTNALNREGLEDQYNNRQTPNGSMLFLDIDRFKTVNDTHGHPVGDKLLEGIVAILSSVRDDDPVARFGGDELLIMLDGASEEVALERGRVICELIDGIQEVDSRGVDISTSVGIALFDEDTPFKELYRRGDLALYAAKKAGGNQVVAYSDLVAG
ncbi:MAG TPA: GGDEF domain-containing protein [Candidatus Saccharibacteria bacterium]|nr:GGDEF domain-containing protein [Candidatus Saccharibacteria bacterium]